MANPPTASGLTEGSRVPIEIQMDLADAATVMKPVLLLSTTGIRKLQKRGSHIRENYQVMNHQEIFGTRLSRNGKNK